MSIRFAEKMNMVKASFIRESLKFSQKPGVISLAGGFPAPELFPIEEFKKACSLTLDEMGKSCLQYDTTEGYEPLRKYVAEVQMKNRGVVTTADDILITSGSQQGLDLVGKLFLDKDDIIICESPTYIGAINAFNPNMPKYVQIAMDDDGMKMDELEKALEENPKAKFIYTIPDFQNPTGLTLSLERRIKMLELAEKYNTPILEDSPYINLRFEGESLPSIKSFDKKGLVIHLGSFSKIFAPGLRIGWVNADAKILSKVNTLKQGADLQSSSISQRELYKLTQIYDFDAHIKKINALYSKRRNIMFEEMEKVFPSTVTYTKPKGGFFVWVTLPENIDTLDLLNAAMEEMVSFVPGFTMYADNPEKNKMRLNFASMDEDKMIEGIKRIGRLISKYAV